jgi:hypothetical protein
LGEASARVEIRIGSLNWPQQTGGIALSLTTDFSAHPSAYEVIPRVPKRQRTPKHARNGVKLDTVMGVAREMARLLRLSYNGHLPAEELTKYIFALDKLRACLESAIAIEAAAAAKAPAPPTSMHVSIVSVPSGTFFDEAAMQKLHESADKRTPLIEHVAAQEPGSPKLPLDNTSDLSPPEQSPPIDAQDNTRDAADPRVPSKPSDEEPDPLRKRARELGFELLPRRPARVD